MFVRFRKTPNRLQVSILEAHRAGGKVTNEHIASLGSVERPPSVQARQIFWETYGIGWPASPTGSAPTIRPRSETPCMPASRW